VTEATIRCECCKRVLRVEQAQKLCWECQGRPKSEGYVKAAIGARDPACPHEVPKTVV
jgi:hypothetical protein